MWLFKAVFAKKTVHSETDKEIHYDNETESVEDVGCRFICYNKNVVIGVFDPFAVEPDFTQNFHHSLDSLVNQTMEWIRHAKGDVFALTGFDSKVNKLRSINLRDYDSRDYVKTLIRTHFKALYVKYIKEINQKRRDVAVNTNQKSAG